MIVKRTIGQHEWTAIVGQHEGSDNRMGTIRVLGPGIDPGKPVEYARRSVVMSMSAETEGFEAIRYTVDNIILPKAVDALTRA